MGLEAGLPRPLTQPALPALAAAPKGQAEQPLQQLLAHLMGTGDGDAETQAAARTALGRAALAGLARETDSALARIRLTQMATRGLLSEEGNAPQTHHASHRPPMDLVVDLPLALGNQTAVLQMQVGRDRNPDGSEEGEEGAWRLRFAVDTVETGPVEASVSLRGQGTFISLWLDRAETYQSLSEDRALLEAALADAGLDLQELRLLRGLPVASQRRAGAQVDTRG